ncbi:ATP-binding protein [Crateriforma conspicua]|uniref:histidine kinase n=1 Tax=Crateriforma conspicua TaxID=2527996 RepID=A0A5C6FIR4_9PLAN|nr:ATP-binding protein [Crateriforma conspicua]TWU62135.1 Sporulation kinase A [Crateriforma conspicua]
MNAPSRSASQKPVPPNPGQPIAPEYFRAIAEGTVDWEIWFSTTGDLLWVNDAVRRFTGYTPQECSAMDAFPLPLIVEEDRQRMAAHLRNAVAGSTENNVEFRVAHRDGSTPWMAMSWQPLRDDDGQSLGFRVSVRDVTEIRELREKLRLQNEHLEQLVQERTAKIAQLEEHRLKMEKLAAIGELAAGVAHEINNPLAGIRNAFALLKRHLPDTVKHYDKLSLIDDEIERISSITHQMHRLYRPSEQSASTFSIHETQRHVESLTLPTSRKHGVAVQWHFEPLPSRGTLGKDQIQLRRGELKQVLINLIHNAIQASERGQEVHVSIQPHGERFQIVVSDSGSGIPEDLIDRIFDPFVSTKVAQVGQGMGLGLSVTRGLVEGMRGDIRVESQVGRGAVFTVDLPRTL